MNDEGLAAEAKLAIVLGTEGTGLTARTIADCDYTVRIPMQHGVDSLNVAAASAVAFWQLPGEIKKENDRLPVLFRRTVVWYEESWAEGAAEPPGGRSPPMQAQPADFAEGERAALPWVCKAGN